MFYQWSWSKVTTNRNQLHAYTPCMLWQWHLVTHDSRFTSRLMRRWSLDTTIGWWLLEVGIWKYQEAYVSWFFWYLRTSKVGTFLAVMENRRNCGQWHWLVIKEHPYLLMNLHAWAVTIYAPVAHANGCGRRFPYKGIRRPLIGASLISILILHCVPGYIWLPCVALQICMYDWGSSLRLKEVCSLISKKNVILKFLCVCKSGATILQLYKQVP